MPQFGPGDVNDTSLPLDVALTQLGVRETPGQPNRGPEVDEYLRAVGLEPDPKKNPNAPAAGYSWCLAFIVWCHRKAGVKIPRYALVKQFWENVEAHRVENPEPGDIFIHLRDDGKGHVGFVEAVLEDGSLQSIEGNSNHAGSREGDGVVNQKRPRDYCVGFVRFI